MINLPDRPNQLEKSSLQGDDTVAQANFQHWWSETVGLPMEQVRVRARGNILYVLCEAAKCPDQQTLRSRVIRGLLKTQLIHVLPPNTPEIYQVTLYGKQFNQQKPTWARVIYVSQLEEYAQHQAKLKAQRAQAANSAVQHPHHPGSAPSDEPTTAILAVSNRQSAQQGQPEAIARHLSELLSPQGIAVRAGMKALLKNGEELPLRRLVIFCDAAYSPDPALLIEPIAQKLRDLKLTTFRDAVVYGHVQGEPNPEWKLRIDLTPPSEMLREWARWGDLEAILQLVNGGLADQQIVASGIVLDMILHLTFWRIQRSGHANFDAPPQQYIVRVVAELLEQVAPQGVHAVMLAGAIAPFTQPSPKELVPAKPSWTNRLDLPASQQKSLADPTEYLARKGNIAAISFLLTRLLNPELAQKLATGGINVQAGHREDLLHVMVDGPSLPIQKAVLPLVAEYLKNLKISGVNGLRLYGRRAGEKHPRWREAVDFVSRQRLVPEASPEFAASEAYVGDLITQQRGALVVRPDLNADEMRKILGDWIEKLRQLLIGTQIFAPLAATRSIAAQTPTLDKAWFQDVKVAAVWGAMGVLLALCADWGLGMVVPASGNKVATSKSLPQEMSLTGLPLSKSATAPDAFNGNGFTGKEQLTGAQKPGTGGLFQEEQTIGSNGKPLIAAPVQPKAIIDPAFQTRGEFNTPQLNDKVALYEQFVAQSGVPDILVIGSSRAMRGIDPVALQEHLAAQGYSGRKIFNFGINGATAQVVDLVLRRLVVAEKLPRLIIWADGARALNSGRVDLTYNAIVASPGYAQLPAEQGQSQKPLVSLEDLGSGSSFLANQYQALNSQMNQVMAKGSSVYEQRSELVDLVRDRFVGRLFPQPGAMDAEKLAALAADDLSAIDVNGFLPLSVRFNPTTYYQKYARVSGANDADYSAFQLQGRQTESLKSVSAYVKQQGSALVFVNLPMTAEYLDADRRTNEDAFQQFMIQSAANDGFTYRNLADSLKTNTDYFSDPSHLNRYGANAVSQILAQDVLIPWGAQ
jgi:hypothetical protein